MQFISIAWQSLAPSVFREHPIRPPHLLHSLPKYSKTCNINNVSQSGKPKKSMYPSAFHTKIWSKMYHPQPQLVMKTDNPPYPSACPPNRDQKYLLKTLVSIKTERNTKNAPHHFAFPPKYGKECFMNNVSQQLKFLKKTRKNQNSP